MRVGTLIQICNVFHITPNDILTDNNLDSNYSEKDILKTLSKLSTKDKNTILNLLSVYIKSIE